MNKYKAKAVDIENFLNRKKIAILGVSRNPAKFGSRAAGMLQDKGIEIMGVHPQAAEIQGLPCCASVADLPPGYDAALLVIPPAETEKVIPQLAENRIRIVWMQQGAASTAAVETARKLGLRTIAGECIYMFARPVQGGHAFHRTLRRMFGGLPTGDNH